MLEPKKDRLEYKKLLTPPDGYRLDFAVGTTYSLDLESLISICTNLENDYDNEENGDIPKLIALQKVCKNLVIFCQKGQIKCPNKPTQMFVLLEQSVKEIKPNKTFHPKTWLLKFIDKEGICIYRFIVLSKNLTFDNSWEVAVSMEGEKKKESNNEKNRNLISFLEYLLSQIKSDDKAKKINELIKDLDYVVFDNSDYKFFKNDDYSFIPLGIDNFKKDYPLFNDKKKIKEMLIVSPFLSSEVIRAFNDRWDNSECQTRPVLITREESLNGFKKEDVSNFDIYRMREEVMMEEDTSSINFNRDIHAKLYYIRTDNNSEIYIGSMNATNNAINSNYEFMMRFSRDSHVNNAINIDNLKRQLFGDTEEDINSSPFELIEFKETKEKSKEEDLETELRKLLKHNFKAEVQQEGDKFKIVLSIGCKKNDNIFIRPLYYKDDKSISKTIIFSGLKLAELSQWYKITVKGNNQLSRIIFISTMGIPREKYNSVLENFIRDEDTFYNYIHYVLSGCQCDSGLIINFDKTNVSKNSKYKKINYPSLYEDMLKIAATEPSRLKDINDVFDSLKNKKIIPNDFQKLFEEFRKIIIKNKYGKR